MSNLISSDVTNRTPLRVRITMLRQTADGPSILDPMAPTDPGTEYTSFLEEWEKTEGELEPGKRLISREDTGRRYRILERYTSEFLDDYPHIKGQVDMTPHIILPSDFTTITLEEIK